MRKSKALRLTVLGLAMTLACGGSEQGGTDEVDLVAERAAFLPHGQAPTVAATAKGVTALFIQEDPTLDPGVSAATNAQNIKTQVSQALASCPNATIATSGEASVTVAFGSGCSLAGLGSLSGSVGVAVTITAEHAIKVAFTFTALQVDGRALDGTAAVTTADGTRFSFDVALQSAGGALTLSGATLVLDADGHGATLDGQGTYRPAAGSLQNLTFRGVHHGLGSCYADAGSVASAKTTTGRNGRSSTVSETIAFGATTPSTGQVQITVGKAAPVTSTLPSYGSCPHS